ncbi:hypothetical protein DERP_003995 [Dermatophagoides pteronyssinus]|uniref:Choline/ethanolamine kinase-like n=1 Tax=Dermatophagoides pteronyssinus TaxID=6956 RepID=A0ABQ8J7U7_DERPT|nr:hypothetical protein DERP_003995 [Dermatophagoides pteronyssinus]
MLVGKINDSNIDNSSRNLKQSNNETNNNNDSEPTSESSTQMRDQAYEICRKYLSGEWNKISSDDMIFKTVSGGLSNLLYYCSLPATHTPVTGEPSQVLLRMYGQLLDRYDTKITDSVITMLLSERKLGPKLYGIFPGGRLEEYIPARAMTCSELSNPLYSAIIARKLAIVHHLNVPINKEPTWLTETMQTWLEQIRKVPFNSEKMSTIEQELIRFDYENEIKILFRILEQCESPVVFCHNDLQEGNILLPSDDKHFNSKLLNNNVLDTMTKSDGDYDDDDEQTMMNGDCKQKQRSNFDDHIVFIDFEFCAYNYRGSDIANHFVERMFDYSNPEWPHYYSYMDRFPNDDEKRLFIREYLKQCSELNNTSEPGPYDNEEHLIKEVNFYALVSHLLWTLWSINNARTSKISFGYLEYGKTRLEAYQMHKKFVIEKYCLKID